MKVKILTSFPKKTFEVDEVWFSADLHLDHESVIKHGRKFDSVVEMNDTIIHEINKVVRENDLLVLLGDTLMGEKDYESFLNSLRCKYVIMLYGNHCNIGKLQSIWLENTKLLYQGYYLELNVEGQIICCSHFPQFNWNYQDDGSWSLHGHLHSDENPVLREIHKYKSMDVGIDNYYKMMGEYGLFSFNHVKLLLRDNLIMKRH